MKFASTLLALGCIGAPLALPQGRPVDWPASGGDARRSGWEKSDLRITKDNVKDFKLLYKRKFEGTEAGARSLTPPVVIGLLISYRGFKELGFISNSSGDLWALDLDTNKVFWTKKIGAKGSGSRGNGCNFATIPALTPPVTFGGQRPRPAATNSPSPGLPPTTAGASTNKPANPRVGGTGFGAPRPVYVLSSDGKLHLVNTSDGSDQYPALDFLPAQAKGSALTLQNSVMYTTTSGNCGGAPNAVWALNLAEDEPKTVSYKLADGDAAGLTGFALAGDGKVFVQTSGASASLVALSLPDLKESGKFTPSEGGAAKSAPGLNQATPVVFEHKGREMVATAGADGRVYLLDASSLSKPVAQSSVVAGSGGGIWGGLASWEDGDGVRWIAAPVWGSVNKDLQAAKTNGDTPNGAVVAFKVEEKEGKPVLTPGWVSRDLQSPVPPVVTSGLVFALSTGGYTQQGGQWRAKSGGKATLFAFDGATGKEMYSTGDQVTGAGSLTGLTVVNGRVFFTTADGSLYAFGIFMEI